MRVSKVYEAGGVIAFERITKGVAETVTMGNTVETDTGIQGGGGGESGGNSSDSSSSSSVGKNRKTTEIVTTEEVASIHIPLANMQDSELFLFTGFNGTPVQCECYLVFPADSGGWRKVSCCSGELKWDNYHYGRIFNNSNKYGYFDRHTHWWKDNTKTCAGAAGSWIADDTENGLYIVVKNADTVIPVGARFVLTEVY